MIQPLRLSSEQPASEWESKALISRPPSQFALAQKLRTEAVVVVKERRKARVVEGFIVDGDELDGGEMLGKNTV